MSLNAVSTAHTWHLLIQIHFLSFFLLVLGIAPRASGMLDKNSITELLSPTLSVVLKQSLVLKPRPA